MSFTLLFSSYLFHFFPLPCSHIFSCCLLSLAVAWVTTSQKYWFLQLNPLTHPRTHTRTRTYTCTHKESLIFSFSFSLLHFGVEAWPNHFTRSSSHFILSVLFPLLFFCLLLFFFPLDITLWLYCLRLRGAESRGNLGCGGRFFLYNSFTAFFPRSIIAAQACVQALSSLPTSAIDDS